MNTEKKYEVGFHPGMPSAEYHAIDAVSSSRLKHLAKSPAHLKQEIDYPSEPSDAMRLGSIIHCAFFEPDIFDDQYIVMPDLTEGLRTKKGEIPKNPKNTDEYRDRVSEWRVQNHGREVVEHDDYMTALSVANALRQNPDIEVLHRSTAERELTGLWIDEETGLLRKMRTDAISDYFSTLVDLKKTTCALRHAFEKQIFDMRYYWQGATYLDGARALGRPMEHYVIVAVEAVAPFASKVYRLRDDIIELGRREIRPLLRLYRDCKQKNEWPGYPGGVEDIGVPGWAINRIENELPGDLRQAA